MGGLSSQLGQRLLSTTTQTRPPDNMGHGDDDDDDTNDNAKDDDDDDDSSNVNHDKAMLAHPCVTNNKSILEGISCWHLKLISNFSKAANKSWLVWSKQMPIGIDLCPDCIPLFWFFSTI